MPSLSLGAFDLAYEESGSGPATVLVHGMASSRAEWGEAGAGRVVAYDRRGYGDSTAPEPYTRTTVNEQAEDLAAVVEALEAAPALLVGADFGALAVLDVLLRHPALARAAVLIDPPLYAFAPEMTETLSAERLALEEALRDGGPEEAVARWLEPRGAAAERVERARRDAHAFFADYGGLATLPVGRRDLRGIDVPVGVVAAGGSAADAVLSLVPQACRFGDWREAVSALA